MASVAVHPLLKQYWLPLLLFVLGLYFQLVVLPSSYPPTHYDVLGVERDASIDQVNEAYERLSHKWFSGVDRPITKEFIKARYAFELLTNPVLKRDYDLFGYDELLTVIQNVQGLDETVDFSKINLPLLNVSLFDSTAHDFNVLTREKLISSITEENPLLIQVYSSGSPRCAQFISNWKRIDSLLEGVADTAMVELGDVHLAAYLAEKKFNGKPLFRNGLPALVANPPNCRRADCHLRYHGELSVEAIIEWMTTTVLGLPRIFYYNKESLGPKFIKKTGHRKVKVICFSRTGERAAPFLCQAAQEYSSYASFALVLWREEDADIWSNMFDVESAPAIVFLSSPGVKPVVYHGSSNSSQFKILMEENKHQQLPQLRSNTAVDLGCDARGPSRAGNDTMVWYCVIVVGRPGDQLRKMRETVRRIQDKLIDDAASDEAIDSPAEISVPAVALKEKRLTFAWLDGEVQKQICIFYVTSDYYGTCGPRTHSLPLDKNHLVIARFQRNSTINAVEDDKRPNNIWQTLLKQDANYASLLVARYNGSEDTQEIVQWISQIIMDGDTREIPFFAQTVPQFIREVPSHKLSKGVGALQSAGKGLKQRVQNLSNIRDYFHDPRVGPMLLLCACISFGTIWLKSSLISQSTRQGEADNERSSRRPPNTSERNHDRPYSITDEEPKNAHQLLSSDSD